MGNDSEKILEKRLRETVKKLGGFALKWTSPGSRGVPDRIVVMPGNKIYFVELKSTGKTLEPLQLYWMRELKKLNCKHYIVDSFETLEIFIHDIRTT